ncbi:hypothetical protein ENUP19_0057G0045 [Entamoeba nuttalli]|uniref:Uncharacterized protein n=2 Tax=Entamoeba nuttalli TaxID=412467 RepID=K2HGE2_ENTNP|nr:hypothetical protein ENU1_038290 [Entamoeba nuttalli P19]EKE41959.1 hypothetical protein ENU1_038290 [Entamoeba nuttalli P19]|eukprot:XP_008855705.1 hypothetical protein ENU1_038290 [Entamoeba nuttalli P19]
MSATEEPTVVERNPSSNFDKPKKDKKKSHKKSKKVNQKKTKLIVGASDYVPEEQSHKEQDQKSKQTSTRTSQRKPRVQQGQMSPLQLLELNVSYQIACLFEENSLSSGSFIRKFMDDKGFISTEILAKLLACSPENIQNAVEFTQKANSKIIFNASTKSVGLNEKCANYSLPLSERVNKIEDKEVLKYQRKAQEWIMKGSNSLVLPHPN